MAIDDIRDEMGGDGGLDGMDDAVIDGFSTQGGKRRVGSGAIVMVLLVAGSIGGLYSMRTLGTSNAGTQTDRALEETIVNGLRQLDAESMDLASATDLMPDFSGKQVPADSMTVDPFRSIVQPEVEEAVEVEPITGPTPEEIERSIRVAGESGLEVTSIVVGGSTRAAIVNGEMVRKGDRIQAVTPYGAATFEVAEIVRDAIRLRAEHPELDAPVVITLTLLAGG